MRCFVAAWPDDATRRAIDVARAALPAPPGARPMQERNVHLTLAFIGTLAPDAARRAARACAALRCPAVDWVLDRVGWFPRARVAWLGGPASEPLDALARAVRAALDETGTAYDHRAFAPHITLWRNVRDFGGAGPIAPGIAWRIEDVALFESTRDAAGPLYRRVG